MGLSFRIQPSKILASLKNFEFIGLADPLLDVVLTKFLNEKLKVFLIDVLSQDSALVKEGVLAKHQSINRETTENGLGLADCLRLVSLEVISDAVVLEKSELIVFF